MTIHFFLSFFVFLGHHLWHMEVPRLMVESKLQLPAYTTATATWDPSCIYELHHSSWQRQILNPLHGARDRTHILMDTRWIHTTEPWWELPTIHSLMYTLEWAGLGNLIWGCQRPKESIPVTSVSGEKMKGF